MPADPHQVGRQLDYPSREELLDARVGQRRMVALAVISSLAFGAMCTALGIGVVRAVNPCANGCLPRSPQRFALYLLEGGPGMVSLMGSAMSLWALRTPTHPRPWAHAISGCLASVLVVILGSMVINAA